MDDMLMQIEMRTSASGVGPHFSIESLISRSASKEIDEEFGIAPDVGGRYIGADFDALTDP
jgi:hypothetical protein